MKFSEYTRGMLVEPLNEKVANYRPIEARADIKFKPGMIGVVKHSHPSNGVLVEYFDPVTGIVETCRTKQLKRLPWPNGTIDLTLMAASMDSLKRFWISGCMDFLAAAEYLKAISMTRPAYLNELNVETLRIPGVDIKKGRKSLNDPAKQFYRSLINARFELIDSLFVEHLKTGTNG